MPRLDRREVLRELETLCPGMPVIPGGGFNEAGVLGGIAPRPGAGHLSKPYPAMELAAMLEKVLNPAPGDRDAQA